MDGILEGLDGVSNGAIVVVAIVLILREVRGFIDARNGNGNRAAGTASAITTSVDSSGALARTQIAELYAWHNVRSADGRPLWYVSPRIEETLKDVSQSTAKTNELLVELLLTLSKRGD